MNSSGRSGICHAKPCGSRVKVRSVVEAVVTVTSGNDDVRERLVEFGFRHLVDPDPRDDDAKRLVGRERLYVLRLETEPIPVGVGDGRI